MVCLPGGTINEVESVKLHCHGGLSEMNMRRWIRPLTPMVTFMFTMGVIGCGPTTQVLTREELIQPEPARSYTVHTVDGNSYTFLALHLEGDTLLGTERITSTVNTGEGEDAKSSIRNTYETRSIPWSEVRQVEAEVEGNNKGGVWLIAASVVAGAAAFLLLTDDSRENPPDPGGGGKN